MEALTVEQRKEIQERYSNLKFPDPVLEPIWYGKRPTNRVNGKKAIVDQSEDNVFGICSDLYQIIHYEDIIKMVETTVKNLPEFGEIEILPQMIGNGEKMLIKAKFIGTEYEIKKGDVVNPQIAIRTSYDLGWKLVAMFGAFRLVCSNGMTVGKIFSKFAKRHMVSLEPASLTKSIQEGMINYSEQTGLWQKWANKKLTSEMYDTLWEALPFTPGEKEKIEALPEVATGLIFNDPIARKASSIWDFHSVLTQYITHEVKSEVRKTELESLVAKTFDTIN